MSRAAGSRRPCGAAPQRSGHTVACSDAATAKKPGSRTQEEAHQVRSIIPVLLHSVSPSLCTRARSAPSLSLSPGQEAQLRLIGRLMGQPTHPTTRQLLSDTFGVAIPHSVSYQKRRRLPQGGHLAAGTTIAPLTTLPQAHRRDALVRIRTITLVYKCMYN